MPALRCSLSAPPIELKSCRKCGEAKPFADFHADKASRDGRASSCKACKRAYFSGYYAENKQEIIVRTMAYLRDRPEMLKRAKKAWAQANRKRESANAKRRHAERYVSDTDYRLRFILRGHLRRCLSGGKPSYGSAALRQRIEMNFAPGMSWGNYGQWHIDHRVPMALMIARSRRPDQINCLANLRPMWAAENLSKGARFVS